MVTMTIRCAALIAAAVSTANAQTTHVVGTPGIGPTEKGPEGPAHTPRGIQDCDGNGIDDAIDSENDRVSPGGFLSGNQILPCVFTTFDTIGSDFDTEMAIFDDQGTLLASNDDIEPGNLQSAIDIRLDPGLYFVAVTGFNAVFADGFSVTNPFGCPVGGNLEVTLTNINFGRSPFQVIDTIDSGRVRWIRVSFIYGLNEDTDFDDNGICDPAEFPDDFAQRFDMGVVAQPGDPITFDTTGSTFANEIAIYNADGSIIDRTFNSNTNDNSLTANLPEGQYLVGFAAQGTLFGPGPEVFFTEGFSGDLAVGVSSPTRTISTGHSVAPGHSRWYEFSVAGDVGPDCDFDGVADADELDCNNDGIPDDCQIFQNLLLGGVAGTSDAPIEINTFGSDFDSEIAVWDYTTGELLAQNDDFDGANNRQSQIVRTYEPGEYLLAISGFNTLFSDFSPDFQFGGITVNASGCAASGSATVTIGENTGSGIGIGSGRVQLVPFTVLPGAQPCNAADLATPFEVLDLADINAFIDGFTSQSPAGDLNSNGIWDLTDIGLFVNAFTAGCP
jgi:hypothetical protein